MRAFLKLSQRRDDARSGAVRRVALAVAVGLMALRLGGAIAFGDSQGATPMAASAVVVAMSIAAGCFGYGRAANVLVAVSVFKLGAVEMGFWSVMCFRVGRRFPLVDPELAHFDRMIGFDWPSYMHFVDAHAWMNTLLYPAYMSIFCQPVLIAVALLLAERDREAIKLMLAMTVTLMATLLVACIAPAYGAYHFFGFDPSMHPHIANLVTGDGTTAALDWLRSENPSGDLPESHGGLVSFPSFHTAAALLFVWYGRRLGRVFVLCVAGNVAMLLATPLHGSHYLADMLGGATVAVASIAIVDGLLERAGIRGLAPVDRARAVVAGPIPFPSAEEVPV